MKKWMYHPILKGIAWLLLLITMISTIVGGVFTAVYLIEGGDYADGSQFMKAAIHGEEDRMLGEMTEYYSEHVRYHLESLTWGDRGNIEYLKSMETMFSQANTNFRFFIEPVFFEFSLYSEDGVVPELYNDINCLANGIVNENVEIYSFYSNGRTITAYYYVDDDYPVKDNFYWIALLGEASFNYKNEIFVGTIVSFLCFCLLIVYLIKTVGRREPKGEIKLTVFHRIPYELCVAAGVPVAILLVELLDELLNMSWTTIYAYMNSVSITLAILILLATYAFFSAIVWTLIVRFKSGKWYTTFLCYTVLQLVWWCLRKLGNGFCKLGRALVGLARMFPLYARFAIVYVILCILEVIGIVCSDGEQGVLCVLWGIEKVLVTPILLWYIISLQQVRKYGERLAGGDLHEKLDKRYMAWHVKKHAENLEQVQAGMEKAVGEQLKSERMKTELITNVSHDIKTPLTSIINYVDLLKKEDLQPEVAKEYLMVLDRQSARLKKLTEDIVEASKAASGALPVQLEPTSLEVLLPQVIGEYEERMAEADLTLVCKMPESLPTVLADATLLWRVLSNLFGNAYKYSQPGTRIYFSAREKEHNVELCLRNISAVELNITGDELMERFVRGDDSRNTEGSGLGLSIAKSLLDLMHGEFSIQVDGDLFKVLVTLPKAI